MALARINSRANGGLSQNANSNLDLATGVAPKRGMVLPFLPLAMSFDDVNYYVDMPAVSTILVELVSFHQLNSRHST